MRQTFPERNIAPICEFVIALHYNGGSNAHSSVQTSSREVSIFQLWIGLSNTIPLMIREIISTVWGVLLELEGLERESGLLFLQPCELGFLHFLRAAEVPLSEYEFPANKSPMVKVAKSFGFRIRPKVRDV